MANKNLREWFQATSEEIELGEEFKIEDIPELELPENFNDDFHKKYLTITAAKNNSELMGHFKGKYLSSTDLKLKNGFIANGGTEEEFNALKEQEPDTLKLFDLVFDKVKEAKPTVNNNIKPDKEFESYKKETIKQIEELKAEILTKDEVHSSKMNETIVSYQDKIKTAKINELLSGIKFDSTIPNEDLKLILNSKINASPYLIKVEEDEFKIYDRAEPDNLALKDGKELQLSEVIAELAQPYTAKNDQPKPTEQNRTITVPVESGSNGEGKYITGHKDYGKK